MSLRLSELHPVYRQADPAEARLIANLGAEVYVAVRDRLRETWTTEMSAEEGAKADVWRTEGRVAALEEVKGRLSAAEEAVVRAATAEGTVSALRAAMEAEVMRRVAEALEGVRKDYDLEKLKEMVELREQIAATKPAEELLDVMREKVIALEASRDALQAQLMEHMAANTKSSHVIGKAGEATVWEMIETSILPEFPYAEAKNMAGVSHAADFHLWVMGPSGRRMKMLIDSKKYKRAVNSDEINKLIADVDADEEAHAGMMVSLTSPIFTKKQFEIRSSPKQKPILYMSFYDLGTEFHRQLLCNGVRALVAVVNEMKEEKRSVMIEQFDEIVAEVTRAARDIDGVIKVQVKSIDSLRQIKASLLDKIATPTGGNDEIEHSEDVAGRCIVVLKSSGKQCANLAWSGGVKCKVHTTRKVREALDGGGGGGPALDLSGET
jgi:hypothetical protein